MRETLVIIGAGGHGKVVADIAVNMNKWSEIIFLDDKITANVMGFEVKGNKSEMKFYKDTADFFVGIGNNLIRQEILEELSTNDFKIISLLHPQAIIGKEVTIGAGCTVMAGAIVNSCSNLGKGCIINTNSSVDHDSEIEDYVHISPGTTLAGNVHIGTRTMIGAGSTVINNLTISKDCKIGAGAVVVKNLIQPGIYIGVPAKLVNK